MPSWILPALVVPLLATAAPAALAAGGTERVSVSSAGTQSAASCFFPSLSGDGRLVAFHCVPGEAGIVPESSGHGDVYLRDRTAGTTTLVSGRRAASRRTRTASTPLVSRDGGCVAFQSYASDLVGGDTNGARDVFVRDLKAGTTTRASLGTRRTAGPEAPARRRRSPPTGRFVAFDTRASNLIAGVTVQGIQLYGARPAAGATTLEFVGYDGKPGDDNRSASRDQRRRALARLRRDRQQRGPERPQPGHFRRVPARPADRQDGAW